MISLCNKLSIVESVVRTYLYAIPNISHGQLISSLFFSSMIKYMCTCVLGEFYGVQSIVIQSVYWEFQSKRNVHYTIYSDRLGFLLTLIKIPAPTPLLPPLPPSWPFHRPSPFTVLSCPLLHSLWGRRHTCQQFTYYCFFFYWWDFGAQLKRLKQTKVMYGDKNPSCDWLLCECHHRATTADSVHNNSNVNMFA